MDKWILTSDSRAMRLYMAPREASDSDFSPTQSMVFESLVGEECLSELADFTVTVLHPSSTLDLKESLAYKLSLEIKTSAEPRYLGGLVYKARFLGAADPDARFYRYEFKVSPWLWLTTLNHEFRIFQEMTVPEIVQEVLGDYPYAVDFQLSEDYPRREYCVQYGESDFNFISRLLEEEGIHYYVAYEPTSHHIVFCDSLYSHPIVTGYEQVPYYARDKMGVVHEEYLTDYQPIQTLIAGKYYSRDYTFLYPWADLMDSTAWYSEKSAAQTTAEIFEWPGGYDNFDVAERYMRNRSEEIQGRAERLQYTATVRGLALGTSFQIQNDPKPRPKRGYYDTSSYDGYYVVERVRYDLFESPYQTLDITSEESKKEDEASFRCLFHLQIIEMQAPFRPVRVTPKPRTYGPQTAVVVGPEGYEIWTNEYGQVKVQFQWDRRGKSNEQSSCWVRVSSAWASARYGAIQVPRIGDEVIVDFLNGDPDRPIITGRVFNGANMPPWGLPQHATQAGIYTQSSPDGERWRGNALRFEDKTDHEEVYLHAQKDLNEKVGHHLSLRIDMNQVESVGHNKGMEVSNNLYEVIGGDMTLSIGPSQTGRFTPAHASRMTEGIGHVAYELGTPETAAKGGGNLLISVEHNKLESVGSDASQLVNNNKQVTVLNNYVMEVGEELLINANARLVLKCGQSLIVLNPDGTIQLNGDNLKVNFNDVIRLLSDVVKMN